MTTKSTTKPKEMSIENLQKLVFELQEQIADLKKDKNEIQSNELDIRPDKYVSIMSLLPYTLILSTEGNGKGKQYKFKKFGEKRRVLYKDLVDIVETNRKFLESGYFYILGKNVIRSLGLDDIYEQVLNKEQIEKILNTIDVDDAFEVFKSASTRQKETLITMLVKKLKDTPDKTNMNFIDKVSRETGVDIFGKVEDIKTYEEMLKEEE